MNWQERQDASVARYESERYNADLRRFRLFGGFLAATIKRDGRTLDIGCGISPTLPPYVDELDPPLTDYIGIDPLEGPPREYAFRKALAEDLPFDDASVDAVIFATSFDHIADDEGAFREAKRVLKPEGRIYMWQSIQDPDTIAINSTLHRLTRGPHMIPAVALQAATMSYRMRKRKRDLAEGNRLDAAHERWYTREGLRKVFGRRGFEIARELEPFGLPFLFIEAHAKRP